jgi:hypothetical protein
MFQLHSSRHQVVYVRSTGRFIMFSVITNIYNNKTNGPTLMELFTATQKLKVFFLTTGNVRCVHHGWHGTHWYDIQVLATRINTGASIFFTAAMIRAFRSARSRGNGGMNTQSLTHPQSEKITGRNVRGLRRPYQQWLVISRSMPYPTSW